MSSATLPIDVWKEILTFLEQRIPAAELADLEKECENDFGLQIAQLRLDADYEKILRANICYNLQKKGDSKERKKRRKQVESIFKDNSRINDNLATLDDTIYKNLHYLKKEKLTVPVNDIIDIYFTKNNGKAKDVFFGTVEVIVDHLNNNNVPMGVGLTCSVIESVNAILREIFDIDLWKADNKNMIEFLYCCDDAKEAFLTVIRANTAFDKLDMFRKQVIQKMTYYKRRHGQEFLSNKMNAEPTKLHFKDALFWFWHYVEQNIFHYFLKKYYGLYDDLINKANDVITDPKSYKDDFMKWRKRVTFYKHDFTQYVICECDHNGDPISILYIGGKVFSRDPEAIDLLNNNITHVQESLRKYYCAIRDESENKNVKFTNTEFSNITVTGNTINHKLKTAVMVNCLTGLELKTCEKVVHHVTKHPRFITDPRNFMTEIPQTVNKFFEDAKAFISNAKHHQVTFVVLRYGINISINREKSAKKTGKTKKNNPSGKTVPNPSVMKIACQRNGDMNINTFY